MHSFKSIATLWMYMAQDTEETEETETKSIWLNEAAKAPFQEYKAILEERANAEQNPSQVVESACKTALEVEQ